MSQVLVEPNPFALMMDPAAVFAAIECSERLARLHSRVCRPLDKPVGVPAAAPSDAAAAFDREVDAADTLGD